MVMASSASQREKEEQSRAPEMIQLSAEGMQQDANLQVPVLVELRCGSQQMLKETEKQPTRNRQAKVLHVPEELLFNGILDAREWPRPIFRFEI